MHIFCLFMWFLCFWNFSRNRLAGNSSPKFFALVLHWFWVPEEESLDGASLAARRHITATQVMGFWLNCLATMNTHQATQVDLTQFWYFGVLSWFCSGKKTILTIWKWLEARIRCNIYTNGFNWVKIVWTCILRLMNWEFL